MKLSAGPDLKAFPVPKAVRIGTALKGEGSVACTSLQKEHAH